LLLHSCICSIGKPGLAVIQFNYWNGIEYNGTTYTGLILYLYNTSTVTTLAGYYPNVALNTWYNFQVVYIPIGSSYLMINNVQAAGSANGGAVITTTDYAIGGTSHASSSNGFNGYVDDFKIYTSGYTITPYIIITHYIIYFNLLLCQ
jgi:hypothetical protein